MTDLTALERRVAWLWEHAGDNEQRASEYLDARDELRRAQKQQERKEAKK